MPLEIGSVTNGDFADFISPLFEAIGGHSNFVNAIYPDNLTQAGQQRAIRRFILQREADAAIVWCKITDTELGEIIGAAQWTVIQDEKPIDEGIDVPPDTWSDDDDKAYAQALYRSFMTPRRKVIEENPLPIITLNIMAVWPKYQGRGAGAMLTEWGTRLADEINAVCVVEATATSRHAYMRAGFFIQNHFHVYAGERFKDRPIDILFFMIRPRPRAA